METFNAWFRMGQQDFIRGLTNNPAKVKHSDAWELWQAGYDAAEFNERYKDVSC